MNSFFQRRPSEQAFILVFLLIGFGMLFIVTWPWVRDKPMIEAEFLRDLSAFTTKEDLKCTVQEINEGIGGASYEINGAIPSLHRAICNAEIRFNKVPMGHRQFHIILSNASRKIVLNCAIDSPKMQFVNMSGQTPPDHPTLTVWIWGPELADWIKDNIVDIAMKENEYFPPPRARKRWQKPFPRPALQSIIRPSRATEAAMNAVQRNCKCFIQATSIDCFVDTVVGGRLSSACSCRFQFI